MQHSENQVIIEQESSKIEKKQWVTPGVETFSKSSVQSGFQPTVEGVNVLGDVTS